VRSSTQVQLEIKTALEKEVTDEEPNGNGNGSGALKNESVENQVIGHNEKEVTTKVKSSYRQYQITFYLQI